MENDKNFDYANAHYNWTSITIEIIQLLITMNIIFTEVIQGRTYFTLNCD